MADSSSSSSSSTETSPLQQLPIPRSYKVLKVLGEGGFGKVVKCVKRSTGKIVAVKTSKYHQDLQDEASMLKVLMSHNLDKFNIIKYYGGLLVQNQMSLVVEMLDISLYDYILDLDAPMRLEDIRSVIQQMATAFNALKGIGVIHADVKLDNIMLVDHVRQPFRVKLIDFGLALHRSQAKQGQVHQTPYYRAPEIMLGLPFSEAIDIWSLGCVMAIMVFGCMLFPGRITYDALRLMTDLLGPPPQHVINAGLKSNLFFTKTDSNQWKLMTPEEYWGESDHSTDARFYTFRSLDEAKTMRLELDNDREPDERRECIELLKAMLSWDGEERITPAGILNHPFITRSYVSSSSLLSSCDEPGPTNSQTKEMALVDDSTSETLPSGVIMVRPAPPMNRIHLEETPDEDRDMRIHPDEAELHSTTTDDSKDQNKKEKKKKRKKNCFRRFCSWIKRTLGSSCCVDVLD